jgi:hypothetical protein
LQKAYFGKVKLIYIDPPYNTGSDSFIYPDRFQESKEDYLKRINDLADDGTLMREGFFRKNSKENGHYHSNWLSMMLPRLYIARNLLREDGVKRRSPRGSSRESAKIETPRDCKHAPRTASTCIGTQPADAATVRRLPPACPGHAKRVREWAPWSNAWAGSRIRRASFSSSFMRQAKSILLNPCCFIAR